MSAAPGGLSAAAANPLLAEPAGCETGAAVVLYAGRAVVAGLRWGLETSGEAIAPTATTLATAEVATAPAIEPATVFAPLPSQTNSFSGRLVSIAHRASGLR